MKTHHFFFLLAFTLTIHVQAQSDWVQQNTVRHSHTDNLYRVDCWDSLHAAIIGGGDVSVTADAGASWTDTSFGSPLSLGDLQYAGPRELFAILGPAISRSTNGGLTWTGGNGADQDMKFYPGCIQFLDSVFGVAVASRLDSGLLFVSTDGGHTWQRTPATNMEYCTGMSFASRDTGCITDHQGVIRRTTDRGAHWQSAASVPGIAFRAIVLDGTMGVAVGDKGTIYRTTNTGATWAAAATPARCYLTAAKRMGDSTFIVAGDSGCILRSTNLGMNWTRVFSGTPFVLQSLSRAAGNSMYATGRHGVILRTDDGGATWNNLTEIFEDLNGVAFANATAETAVGLFGTLVHTTDEGVHWMRQRSGTVGNLWGATFVSPNVGFVVGDSGVVLRSVDTGATWTRVPTAATRRLNGVAFGDSNVGAAVGERGTAIVTTDGGYTWTARPTDSRFTLVAVDFPAPRVIVAAGRSDSSGYQLGVIARSTDLGVTWQSTQVGDTILRSVSFVDSLLGYAPGYAVRSTQRSELLRTTDGGVHWHNGNIPGDYFPGGLICFSDSVNGFGDGWRTTNGGRSWIGLGVAGTGLACFDKNTATVVGTNGSILHTNDGGGRILSNYVIEPRHIDFGDVRLDSTLAVCATCTNHEAEMLIFSGVHIPPDSSRRACLLSLSVADTAVHIGAIHFAGNADFSADSVTWRYHGIGPIFDVSTRSWCFDTVSAGSSAVDTLYVINRGNRLLTVSNVTVTDSHFVVTPKTFAIGVGDSAPLTILFRPDALGSYLAKIGFVHNATRFNDSVSLCADVFTGVHNSDVPMSVALDPVSPNPFSSSATIGFALPHGEQADLTVTAIDGRAVATLFSGYAASGAHAFTWQPSNLPAGAYICRLRTAAAVLSRLVFIAR